MSIVHDKGRSLKFRIYVASLYVFLAAESPVAAQKQWEAYQPRTLSEIVRQHRSEISDETSRKSNTSILLTSDEFPSRVRLVYSGRVRPIATKKRDVILQWAKIRGVPDNVVHLFKNELLFLEDSQQYWIPVQEQLLSSFEQELKAGQEVELFLIWVGTRREKDTVDWVFLGNEFLPMERGHNPPASAEIQMSNCLTQ